jgi:hypothetical protein
MKLWIRSQNKEALANVKNVRFCKMKKCELKETPCTIKEFVASTDAYCVECNGEFFGEYATKERCLEIIDEIQELLQLGNPENAFMHIHNSDMGYDEALEVLGRAREAKAIITQGADFDVKLLSVVVYEMPEK